MWSERQGSTGDICCYNVYDYHLYIDDYYTTYMNGQPCITPINARLFQNVAAAALQYLCC